MRSYCPGDLVPLNLEQCGSGVNVTSVNLKLRLRNGQYVNRELEEGEFDNEGFLLPEDLAYYQWDAWITTGPYLGANGEGEALRCHVLSINVKKPVLAEQGTFTGKRNRPMIKECCE